MSETDSETRLQVSEETIEEKNFEKVLQLIREGAVDAAETSDYLSYSTLLDVQLSEPSRYTIDEREELLAQLLEALSSDSLLVYEIGWDLPSLLIPFIDSDDEFNTAIRDIPCVYKVLKLFEMLAIHGNAKELFLKSNELLASVELEIRDMKWEAATKMYEVKVYCLFELIISCLRRIHTLYPSRFLSMTVLSFINALYLNPPFTMETFHFSLRRMYDFARNYNKPPLPESIDEDEETLKKINDDEEYLQRKLLTAFITEGVNLICKQETIGLSADFFKGLQDQLSSDIRYTSAHTLKQPSIDRILLLTESFDMDLRKAFVDLISTTDSLISFPTASTPDDAYRNELFEKLTVDFQKNFASSILGGDSNVVTDSINGCATLFSYKIATTQDYDLIQISIEQAMKLGLRVLVPGLVHNSFTRRGLQDLSVFWMWLAIEQKGGQNALELVIATIPPIIISTYLQCLMFTLATSFKQSYFRFVTLTLITRLFSCAPETIAYNLLLNSLQECPYENVKAALVQVLKSLLIKDRVEEDLSANMSALGLDKSDQTSVPPPLPSREPPKLSKYINLTETMFTDLISLVDTYIDSAFKEDSLDLKVTPTLQAYLNLLIVIKNNEFVKAEEIQRICKELTARIINVAQKCKNDPQQANSYNMSGMLAVSVERLSENNV